MRDKARLARRVLMKRKGIKLNEKEQIIFKEIYKLWSINKRNIELTSILEQNIFFNQSLYSSGTKSYPVISRTINNKFLKLQAHGGLELLSKQYHNNNKSYFNLIAYPDNFDLETGKFMDDDFTLNPQKKKARQNKSDMNIGDNQQSDAEYIKALIRSGRLKL